MDHRKNYLDGLSRTKLQALAKKCPGVKANWRSQTIRERLLDPIYDIEIPTPASAGQKNKPPSVTVNSETSTRSSVKRKQTEVSIVDRLSKKRRFGSAPTTPMSVSLLPDVTIPPRHGRPRSRGVSAGPTPQVIGPNATIATSGPTAPYQLHDCSSHPGDLSPIPEKEEVIYNDCDTNMPSQQKEVIIPREPSILDVRENATAKNSNGKRYTYNQPRSRPRRRLEGGHIPHIPTIHKGKAKMTLEEFEAWKWDEKVQLILELINRGKQDQETARARKLHEEQQEEKQRQKRIQLARKALFAMMLELGSDFGPVLSSTYASLRACIKGARPFATAAQFVRQDPNFGQPGPSICPMSRYREDLRVVSQAAGAIAELIQQGYTIHHIQSVLFSPT